MLKPSEFASPSVVELVLMLGDILPPGVVNVVTGFGPEVGAALVATRGSRRSASPAAVSPPAGSWPPPREELTPSLMELGGKSALVVCADADLETAVQDALLGIFLANGEVASPRRACSCTRRSTRRSSTASSRRRRRSASATPSTRRRRSGPLITAAHRDRVLGHIENAGAEGLVPRLGGERSSCPGSSPAATSSPRRSSRTRAGGSRITREEVFGPVVVVERWRDEDDAVARANATEYGLGAGVWTTDLARAHRLAARLEAGIVWVNTWFDTPPGSPMGGVKASGFGRELSAETLHEYSAPKTMNVGLTRSARVSGARRRRHVS